MLGCRETGEVARCVFAMRLRAWRRRWIAISERDGAPCSPSAAAPAVWRRAQSPARSVPGGAPYAARDPCPDSAHRRLAQAPPQRTTAWASGSRPMGSAYSCNSAGGRVAGSGLARESIGDLADGIRGFLPECGGMQTAVESAESALATLARLLTFPVRRVVRARCSDLSVVDVVRHRLWHL